MNMLKPRKSRSHLRARPSLAQIEIFLKVVETRSFVGAAKLMGISQPAISQAIAKLEDFYPGDLFVRRRSMPLMLTPVGEALLPLAEAMLHAADQSILRTDAASNSWHGRLSIGFHPGIANGPLRQALIAFRTERPEIDLILVEAMPGELHGQLCERSLDLIFTAFMPDLANPMVAQEVIWSDRLVALLPADHALARRLSVRWADIAKYPIILRVAGGDLSGYRAILSCVGDRSLRCVQYAVSPSTLLQLVTMGFGISISFSSAVTPVPGIVAIPIDDENALVPIEAIWHADDANPIRHRFVRDVRDAVAAASRGG